MREVTGSSPVSSTKKSLLEPLSKSKVSGEDFFYLFLKSGRWGVRVNQKRMFCRIVPGFFSFLGNEDYCFSRNLSPKRWEGEIRIVHDLHNVLTNEISSLILFILIIIIFREGLIIMAYYDAEHKAIIEKFNLRIIDLSFSTIQSPMTNQILISAKFGIVYFRSTDCTN